MEQALAAHHQGNKQRLPLVLSLWGSSTSVALTIHVAEEMRPAFEGQIYSQYPDARLEEPGEDLLRPRPDDEVWQAEISLAPDLFPIRRHIQFEDPLTRQAADPLTGLLAALAVPRGALRAAIDIVAVPADPRRAAQARWALRVLPRLRFAFLAKWFTARATSPLVRYRLGTALIARVATTREGGGRPLAPSGRNHDREDDLQAAADKTARQLFEVRLRLLVWGPSQQTAEAEVLLGRLAGAFGPFAFRRAAFRVGPFRRRRSLRWGREPGFLLSAEELATLWHPPSSSVQSPTLPAVESRELPPPVELPSTRGHSGAAVLGLTTFRGQRRRCGILPDDRLRHVLVVGKSGTGKTTLLHHLLSSDIHAGRGVALLDPHGDLCEAVLAGIPSRRSNEVIIFDAGDAGHPLSFNVLACPRPEQRPLVASAVLSAFKKLWGDFWGPRMEHILRNALLAMLEVPDSSLLGLLRFLTDARYRQEILRQVSDPLVLAFWQREFASLPAKLQAEALSPVLNKIGAFISSPLLRHIVGQSRSSLDLRRTLDEGKILLVNLSKGRIGDDASALLGCFLVSALQLAAFSRAELPEDKRRPFHLYIDEFQNYATDAFAVILSEARKFRLALTLANQYLDQMEETVRSAVFGNVGTMVSFQVGPQDAEVIAEQMGSELTAADLLRLPKHHAYLRLLVDGTPSRPFSLLTLPPLRAPADGKRSEAIRRMSRRRYARPAGTVEREIAAAFGA